MNTKQNDETTTVAACPPLSVGLGGAFQRENRYAVLKWKDVAAALTKAELDDLRHLMWKTHDYREAQGKARYVNCVVVEEDWPEYEPTWLLIEKRMTTPNVQLRGAPKARPSDRRERT